jgi:cell division cycle protein 37
MATNKEALRVFQNDVDTTWARIDKRSGEMAAERAAAGVNSAGEREQIQLVAQDPSTTITFETPDGPPPDEITIEGEGSEEMDVEKVLEFLQKRWEIFESFPKNLKKALQSKSLEEVNKVLGKMAVDEGEETVRLLDEAGILSFSSKDIVDKTQEQREARTAGSSARASKIEEIDDDASLVD